jgi:hydroxypyruvate reductase
MNALAMSSSEFRIEGRRRLLQVAPLPPEVEAALRERHELLQLGSDVDPTTCDGAVTRSRDGCGAALMKLLPRDSVVACFGTGHDSIDLAAARERGIQVSITPDVLTECVADLAFGLLIATARTIVAADRFVRRGDWRQRAWPLATRVSGKRLGILGLGRIGHAVAARARGFGMEIRYHGRSAQAGVDLGFEPDLHALAQWCDFLMVSCVGGPRTHHLVDAGVLQALGPQGILVNVARGSVVDEAALVLALREGHLGGAGLDVFEHEPAVPPELVDDERVVLLPHAAASTHETRADMIRLLLDNLDAFFAQGRVLTPPPA